VSNAAKKLLVDLDVPESEIFTLPNGVDTEKFKKNQAERIDNSILYAGRIIKPKGLHVLLDALEYLDIPVCLKIAGPKQEQGYLEKNLSRKGKQKMGIHEVEWLGSVDQEKIVRVYQQASVFVNPTLREDFGIVNLEALSCETPVIASDTMGLNEVIRNGVNGILVQPNNPRQIANALKKLLENKGLRKKYGRNGRRMIKAHFSWDSIAREAVKIYEKVIKMEKN
jgi:glycosyltransferase involved in cell wall biosynthesis